MTSDTGDPLGTADPGASQRLFVALVPSESVCRDLDQASRFWRRRLPKARWVRRESLHLTMVFLGDTLTSLLDGLHRELGAVCATIEPFALRVDGVGVFPPRGPARVLWAGLEADGDLDGLQYGVVHAAGRAVGRDLRERRPFQPHLTLARCNPPWPPRAVARWREAVGTLASDPFEIDQLHLIASTLRPDGPVYETVATYPLGGEPR